MQTDFTGSYIALAALVVGAAANYGVILNQNAVVAVIAGAVSLVGIIWQMVIHKNTVAAAKAMISKASQVVYTNPPSSTVQTK